MQRSTILSSLQPKNRPSLWVLFFALLGFALRVQRLDFQPLWGDEGWSFYLALQPLPDLLALTAGDIHPPLYYLLLKGWLALVGVGAEEARLLSVIFGTLLIPSLYLLGRRLFERWVGVTGAAVVALMPLAIYYSQEVRMYGLVTLLAALSVYFFAGLARLVGTPTQLTRKSGRLQLAGYVLVTGAACYTHYYAALIIGAQALYGLGLYFRNNETFSLNKLLKVLRPFIGVGLLYLPWLIYLGPRLNAYVENKRDVEGYLPLNLLRFFGDHFVAFSLGQLSTAWRPYLLAALPFALVAVLGFLAALYFNRNRPYLYPFLYLFGPMLVGYGVNLIFPFNPPYFERTLLLAAPAYWLFLAAGLVWLGQRQAWLAGLTGLLLLLLTTVSLLGFYSEPRYPEADYRPLLADIAARASPDDTLLASYQWQVGFYEAYLPEPRPRLFTVPGWGKGWAGAVGQAQLRQDMANIFAQSPRLWFPAYQASGHIWEDQAEAVIAEVGYPALLSWYSPETKLSLAGAPPETWAVGPTANFNDALELTASRVGLGPYETGRGIIPVELTWRKRQSLGSEHWVNLRLVDAAGRTWASRDSAPLAGQRFFTDLSLGDVLADRHGLLVSAGMPPGVYRLFLGVRRESDAQPLDLRDTQGQPAGAELLLGEVTIIDPEPPVASAALPVQVAMGASFGQTARLVGYSLGHGPFKAGQALPLTLFWQALVDQPGSLVVSLELRDGAGQPVVSTQPEPIRPTSTWLRDILLRDPQEMLLPPTLPPGEYQLSLALLGPNGEPLTVEGQEQLWLTSIETIDRPHNFEAPAPRTNLDVLFGGQARLVGLDLPQTEVEAGGQLPLTLYWQAVQPFERSWKVFVHLIDSQGNIVAQQDQIPGAGQFPTTGWLPNEYLSDAYTLPIPPDVGGDSQGYHLRLGFYDANDFSRLPVIEDEQVVGDNVVLAEWPIFIK